MYGFLLKKGYCKIRILLEIEGITLRLPDCVKGRECIYSFSTYNSLFAQGELLHNPAMEEIGIRIADEWNVLIGESPNIFYEGRAAHAEQLLAALKSQLQSNYNGFVLNIA